MQSNGSPSHLSFGRVLAKLRDNPTPPWLERPVYQGFLRAIHPTPTPEEFDGHQQNLWEYLHNGAELPTELRHALSYWDSERIRTPLNALFFGGASTEETTNATGLSTASVEAYKSLFCDLSAFGGSRLLLADYVHQFPEFSDAEKTEKSLYLLAVNYGWEWVEWKVSRGLKGHMTGTKIVDVLINMAFWKSMEAGEAPLGSTKAREGRQFLKQAAELAINKHRSKMGTLNSVKELQIRLTSQDETEFIDAVAHEILPEIEELLYKQEKEEE